MPYTYEDDEFDYQRHIRRYSPPRRQFSDNRRSNQHLNPEAIVDYSLHRSRSVGNRPNPTVVVVNDNKFEPQQPGPSYSRSPSRPRYSPEVRGRMGGAANLLGEELLAEGIAELALDRRRSRSRGRSDAPPYADYRDWELQQKEKELRDLREREEWERKERYLKDSYEMERLRADTKRKAEEDAAEAERRRAVEDFERKQRKEMEERKADERRVLEEYEYKRRKDADDRKADERRVLEEYELKRRKDAEDRKKEEERIIEEHDRKMRKAEEDRKAEELRIKQKLEREEIEAKEKKKRAWEEYERERKEKEAKEKEEKKKEKEKIDEATRKRLAEAGFSMASIERILSEEKEKADIAARGIGTTALERLSNFDNPKYIKVHRKYLDVKTLTYYQIPFTVSDDPDFILVLRHLDQYEIDFLCEHTRRLRAGDRTLLLEPAKDEKKFAWYRRRDRSTSRVTRDGILMLKR